MKVVYAQVEAYVTKDGSVIRELVHPNNQANAKLSLAEATVSPGGKTLLHRHRQTEEIYHVIQGTGELQLGDELLNLTVGDSAVILPNMPHCISNTGEVDLKILCCCSPAYQHDDTELL